ncbi:MAG: HAMP domain-containing histidine kinase [Planctomycetaceae bacterium]|nr:HAMP domain-containing histidine kinase [Planctomycetaceae bacterium]
MNRKFSSEPSASEREKGIAFSGPNAFSEGGAGQRMLVNLSWLIKLRWVACLGQLLVISVVIYAFQVELPFLPLGPVITLTVLTNIGLVAWTVRLSQRREQQLPTSDTLLLVVMILDLSSLTALLYWTGGPNNPFSLFFFVNLSLAGVLLPRVTAVIFHFVGVICFGLLLFVHRPLLVVAGVEMLPPIYTIGQGDLRHFGLFIAFLTCSSVIVYFMTRLTGELRQHELDLRQIQSQKSKSEKYEALGTLAAGAAHELATPLSTIAVVAKEAEAMGRSQALPDELCEDLSLIRSEVERCRRILNRMAVGAGQAIGETFGEITPERLLQDVLIELQKVINEPLGIDLDQASKSEAIQLPPIAVAQALRALVKNAIDAVPSGGPIRLTSRLESRWTLVIQDRGPGMPEEILQRVSEPFFTTKAPGSGMGLGVFLARSVIERLGGQIRIESKSRVGTTVTVTLPRRQNTNLGV